MSKRGRPTIPEDERRTRVARTRLTAAEYAVLCRAAAMRGVTPSEYVRRAMLEDDYRTPGFIQRGREQFGYEGDPGDEHRDPR